MTDAELEAIRERCAKATPGPWGWGNWLENGSSCQYLKSLPLIEQDDRPDGFILSCWCADFYTAFIDDEDSQIVSWLGGNEECPSKENADFIAHARTDIPALLAHMERLQDRIRELEGQQ